MKNWNQDSVEVRKRVKAGLAALKRMKKADRFDYWKVLRTYVKAYEKA